MTDEAIPQDEAARKRAKSAYDKVYAAMNREKRQAQGKARQAAKLAADPIAFLTERRAKHKAWSAANREALRIRYRTWAANNKEKIRACAAASQKKNKHKHVERRKLYHAQKYLENKTEMNAARVARGAKDRVLQRATARLYYKKTSEKQRALAMARHYATWPLKYEAQKKYAAANKDKISVWRRATAARRRLSRDASIENYTQKDIAEIMIMQKHKCAMCKVSTRKYYHIDHIIPIAKGGQNGRRNIQVLCPKCNRKKSAQHPLDYSRRLGLLL